MEQTQNPPGRRCTQCGTAIVGETTGGLCPRCLLEMNLASRTMPGGEPSPQIPPPSPGEIAGRFPQFEIVECLGRGGMGVVYKARQKSLDRWVAIKLLAPERVHDERFAEHFEREAKTLARLSHPNIVTVFDHGEADGLFYIVMEFVDGVNLRDLLMEGKMEPAQALAIVPEICAALQFAHDHGVVHRDIKPENILIDRDGRVKIADFGIAALVGTDGYPSGTPPYMAPEQESAGGTIDHRADIYALGVVLYEMLTGERPDHDPTRPSQRVEIDVRLDEIVLRALEKEPARRYQTAGEFRTVVQTLGSNPIDSAGVHPAEPNVARSENKWVTHIKVLSLCYQISGILLIFGAFVVPVFVGIDTAHHIANWNRMVPLMMAALFAWLAAMGLGLYLLYVGHALGKRSRYTLCRNSAIVLLPLSVLTFPPMAILAIYTLIILNKNPVMEMFSREKKDSDLPETANRKPNEVAGSPPSAKPEARPGPFRRFWWLFLVMPPLCLLLVLTLGGLGVFLSPKQYEARAVIEIRHQASDPDEAATTTLSPADPEWITRLNAMPVLDRVTGQLDLARSWSVDEAQARQSLVTLATFEYIPHTKLRELRIRHTDAKQAAAIANAWALALKEWCAEQKTGESIVLVDKATPSQRPVSPNMEDVIFLYGPIGLLLSPLFALLVIYILHNGYRSFIHIIAITAAAIVLSLFVMYGYIAMARYFAFRNATEVVAMTSSAPVPALSTPEHAARSFMEAIRDGDIDAAMKWMDPSTDTWFDPDFEPGKKTGDQLRDSLQHLSDEMIEEAYAGEMDRLTQFTEWHPGDRDETTRFLAVGIAAPSRWHEGGPEHALYLILSSMPDGWRVAHVGQADNDKSLAEHLDEYLQQRVLYLPVTPPLAMPENLPVTIGQVKTALKRATWGSFLKVLSDRPGEPVTVKEVAANDWNERRYEVAFRSGSAEMLLDLVVDPAFRRVEPTHLRREDPVYVDLEVSEFLPWWAYRYTIRTAHHFLKEDGDPGLQQLVDIQTMETYLTALDAYLRRYRSLPPDTDTLLSADYFPQERGKDTATIGLVQNDKTGAMERPLYHGNKDLRWSDLDRSKFITFAAPTPDRYGRRLVLGLNTPVRLISEKDYQKQIAEQAKTDTPERAKGKDPEQEAAISFMEAIRDGDMDNAMEWLSPELKQKEKFPLHLELASKILRDEIYAGQLDRLTKFTETEFTHVDGTAKLFAARVTPPAGDRVQDGMSAPVLILTPTPEGWRVVHFGEAGSGKSLSEHMKDFRQQNQQIERPADVDAGLTAPRPGPKQVDLLDVREKIEPEKGVRIEVQPPDSSKPDKDTAHAIIGKWQAGDGKTLIEFFSDGTMAIFDGPIKLSITPESISLNDRVVSREELAEELKKWPPETPIQITAARTLDYKTMSGILEICRKANFSNITIAPDPAEAKEHPPMPTGDVAPDTDVRILVKPDGISLDGRKLSHEQLAQKLKQLHPDARIVIAADRTLHHREFMAIMEICHQANLQGRATFYL